MDPLHLRSIYERKPCLSCSGQRGLEGRPSDMPSWFSDEQPATGTEQGVYLGQERPFVGNFVQHRESHGKIDRAAQVIETETACLADASLDPIGNPGPGGPLL